MPYHGGCNPILISRLDMSKVDYSLSKGALEVEKLVSYLVLATGSIEPCTMFNYIAIDADHFDLCLVFNSAIFADVEDSNFVEAAAMPHGPRSRRRRNATCFAGRRSVSKICSFCLTTFTLVLILSPCPQVRAIHLRLKSCAMPVWMRVGTLCDIFQI